MGFLEVWSLINIIMKLTETIDYTWMQVFKPMWLGYSIILGLALSIAAFIGILYAISKD